MDLEKVSFHQTGKPHIKGSNIPLDLIIGHTPRTLQREYLWLSYEQIMDAFEFAADWIRFYSLHGPPFKKKTPKKS